MGKESSQHSEISENNKRHDDLNCPLNNKIIKPESYFELKSNLTEDTSSRVSLEKDKFEFSNTKSKTQFKNSIYDKNDKTQENTAGKVIFYSDNLFNLNKSRNIAYKENPYLSSVKHPEDLTGINPYSSYHHAPSYEYLDSGS